MFIIVQHDRGSSFTPMINVLFTDLECLILQKADEEIWESSVPPFFSLNSFLLNNVGTPVPRRGIAGSDKNTVHVSSLSDVQAAGPSRSLRSLRQQSLPLRLHASVDHL